MLPLNTLFSFQLSFVAHTHDFQVYCFWNIVGVAFESRMSFNSIFSLAFLSGLNMKSAGGGEKEDCEVGSSSRLQEAAAVLLHQIYRRPLHLRLVHLHTLWCTCIPSKYHTPHQNIIHSTNISNAAQAYSTPSPGAPAYSLVHLHTLKLDLRLMHMCV